jgi:ferrochelatase
MSKASDSKKTAIVLFNLGGPDSLKAVKPFLFNLFNDKNIITLPSFFRYFIAWFISSRREKTAIEIYSQMGGKSTILEETLGQANALKLELSDKIKTEFEIFICMRHWHPMTEEIISRLENYRPAEIILVPLYPQFSATTTASSIEEFTKIKNKSSIKDIPSKVICCYPQDDNFVKAHSSLITKAIEQVKDKNNYRILFSAHGLPKKIIESGDPYQWQVESTVNAVIDQMPFDGFDYKITYQSRVGPLEWIGPNTEDEIKIAVKERKELVIVPIAFVSEHSETLVELDIEYKNITNKQGLNYIRVPTLSINNLFIKSLSEIILKAKEKDGEFLTSSSLSRICPSDFIKCPCKKLN